MKKIIILLSLLIIISGCGKKELNDNTKKELKKDQSLVTYNSNENVIKENKIDTLKISNVILKYQNNTSILTFDITNTSDEKQFDLLNVILKDENGNIVYKTKASISKILKKDETTRVTCNIEGSSNNIYSIEYEISN